MSQPGPSSLQEKGVVTANMSSNNIGFVCIKYYYDCLIKTTLTFAITLLILLTNILFFFFLTNKKFEKSQVIHVINKSIHIEIDEENDELFTLYLI